MPAVPVRGGLVGMTGAHQCFLLEMTTEKLERDRGSSIGEPAREGNRGAAHHVERTGEAQQGVQHLGILAEVGHLCGGRRCNALYRHQQ